MATSQPGFGTACPSRRLFRFDSPHRIPRTWLTLGSLLSWPSSCGPIGPRFVELVRIWNSSPDYSHGYLVIPLACWFLWRRRTLPSSEAAPSWCGLSLIVLAAAARMVAARFYFPEFDGCSLPLWLAGAAGCSAAGSARWAAPALAFLLFLVPLPATIETLLSQHRSRQLATTMSTWMLQCLGTAGDRRGDDDPARRPRA